MTRLDLTYDPWYADTGRIQVEVRRVLGGGDLDVADVAGVENDGDVWTLLALEIERGWVTVEPDPRYGHCDTCGFACDAKGCMRERTHRAALTEKESILLANEAITQAARPYRSLGAKHHDPCIAHGVAAPRDCWRGLYGGYFADPASPNVEQLPRLEDAVTALLTAPADAQARILCGASCLLDDDATPAEALGTAVVLEGVWP